MSFKIIRNNIINVSADAIVNTANPEPTYASGVDSAIYKAAGAKKLLKERKKIGRIDVGNAEATPAFKLSAKYIIHTVGPVWQGGSAGEREAVRSCYENSLKLAKELGCESIAFPLIATGVYGFPKAEALQIAISVFSEFLVDSDMEITLVVFDEKSFVLSDKIFSGVEEFIDNNYVTKKVYEEYETEDETRILLDDDRRGVGPRLMAARSSASMPESISERRFQAAEMVPQASLGRKPFLKNKKIADSFEEDKETGPQIECEQSEEIAKHIGNNGIHISLDDKVAHIKDTWQENLLHLIDIKGYTDTEVYKRANVDRKLFSKIRSNVNYQPKKITAMAFALALRLNLDETKDFLSRAGYALSPSSMFDLIVEYFIENEVYDIYTINLALFKHEQQLLGD
ncbi:MAG: macro domain-containing protein [Lachnospiraceae bacterium]|nr:macro domain-containing protein [Lachnospiraceae bacterium]